MSGMIRGFSTLASKTPVPPPSFLKRIFQRPAFVARFFDEKPFETPEGNKFGKVRLTAAGKKIVILNEKESKELAAANFVRMLKEIQDKNP